MREKTRARYERLAASCEKNQRWQEAYLWLQKLIEMGDTKASTLYRLALVSEQKGQLAQAESEMQAIVKKYDFQPAHIWLARNSIRRTSSREELLSAERHLKDAIRLNSKDDKARIALADVFQQLGDKKEAVKQLKAVVSRHPELTLVLAKLCLELDDINGLKEYSQTASKYFYEKSTESPENEDLVQYAAEAMILCGNWSEAKSLVSLRMSDNSRAAKLISQIHFIAFQQIAKDPQRSPEAASHLLESVRADLDNEDAMLQLMRLAPAIARFRPDLLQSTRELLQIAQSKRSNDIELMALVGMLHTYPGGDLRVAEELLEKASENQPTLLLDLGILRERVYGAEKSRQTFLVAAERLRPLLDNANAAVTVAYAEVCARVGNLDEADRAISAARSKLDAPILRIESAQLSLRRAELEPDVNMKVQYLFNSVLVANGYRPAEAMLVKLATTHPEVKTTVIEKASTLISEGKSLLPGHMILGSLNAQFGNWDDSVLHFEQALSLSPRDYALQNNLAWALVNRNNPLDLKRSLELANLAVLQAPLDPNIRETRGLAFLASRQWSNAIADLEIALVSFPDRKSLHKMLAEAYKAIGNEILFEKHRSLSIAP